VGVFLLAAVTGCLQWPSDPPGVQGRDALLEHIWTIILTNDSGRVWVVQSDTTQGRPASLEDTLSATLWTALDGLPESWTGTAGRIVLAPASDHVERTISLIKEGNSQLLYANRGYKIQGPALVFTNPSVPFSWESTDNIGDPAGVFCIFTNSFILAAGGRRTLQESALFKADGNPVFILNATQVAYIEGLFTKMRQELEGDYKYKFDVIGSLITLLIHEALKMQPAEAFTTPANASARIELMTQVIMFT